MPTALSVGATVGLAIGVITVIASACTSFIELIVDRVPEKRLRVFGVGLILLGFALNSVQFWLAFFDLSIRG